jgi:hypothetical protein
VTDERPMPREAAEPAAWADPRCRMHFRQARVGRRRVARREDFGAGVSQGPGPLPRFTIILAPGTPVRSGVLAGDVLTTTSAPVTSLHA